MSDTAARPLATWRDVDHRGKAVTDSTPATAAKFGPLPLWPWVVAWVIVAGSGLTAVGMSVYATVRILNG